MPRRFKRRSLRISERHAAARAVVRTNRPFWRLKEEVEAGRFQRLSAQTRTRTLCLANVDGEIVYFVLNKKRMSIVTVLSRAQARSHMEKAP